ncbi:GNAT family N-acetyltransferase [Enterovibrio norvegicus]|uniref:GNAT family N-acetyltransferase n=1 Tax=Enterovibrio norvegicus TaxID=188144 RepID=UPI003D0D1566
MMIETKRLVLMKISREDLDVISEILSSPIQTKFLPNEAPYSNDQQREYLFNRIEHWNQHDFGTFVVVLKEDPIVKVGFVGAEYAPNPKYVDIRFGIVREYEGKGIITESAKALATWFFENTRHNVLYGVAMTDNFGSKSVLSKMGMEPTDDIDLYDCEGLENFSLKAKNA